jgi:hypothetical protein
MPRSTIASRVQARESGPSQARCTAATNRIANTTAVTGVDTACSIAAWVKIGDDATTLQRILSAAAVVSSTILGVSLQSGILRGGYFNGAAYVNPKSISGIIPHTYYHLVVVWDGSTSFLYVNGVAATGTGNNPSLNQAVGVFAGSTSNGLTAGGLFDQVQVWTRALSATEALNHYLYGSYSNTNIYLDWQLNDASGTTATDASGNSNTGTLTGATFVLNQGPLRQRLPVRDFGTCLFSNGTAGNKVQWASTTPTVTTPITYACWVRPGEEPTSVANSMGICEYGYWYMHMRLAAAAGGINQITIRYDEVSAHAVFHTPGWGRGERGWHHVAATYNPTDANNNVMKLYIDGLFVGSLTSTTGPTTLRLSGGGRVGVGNTGQWKGYLDEFLCYQYVMTDVEILNLYLNGTLPTGQTPVVYFKFNEGSGTTANDSSGNGNSGVITNMTYSTDVVMKARSAGGARLAA